MAPTLGSGPFGKGARAEVNFEIEGPEHLLLFEDYPRRMRGVLGGETVADSLPRRRTRGSAGRSSSPASSFHARVTNRHGRAGIRRAGVS